MRRFPFYSAQARRSALLLVLLLALVASAGLGSFSAGLWNVRAADLAPQAVDRNVTVAVSLLLRREHLSKHPLDDEISERGLKMFLDTLDPMKVYFSQSDVDEFMQHKDQLDNMLQKGDVQLAHQIFRRYQQRVDERVKLIDELLAQEHDFGLEEEMVTKPDLLHYPRSAEEARERWRKRIKYDLLMLKLDKTEGQEPREKLSKRYRNFAKRMGQTSSDELLEMYLTALTSSFDPHTTYMSPGSLENFRILMRLNLEGIGAALRVNEDGYTVVSKIIPGGAADKMTDMKAEDRIVSVGQGEEGRMEDVVDMKLSDVVDMIRGPAGTVVRLGVIPHDGGEKKIYKITRARIELKDSEARPQVFQQGRKGDGSPYKIGVINLPSFYMDMEAARDGQANFKSTTEDVRRILSDFKKEAVDGVVLDLRHNGGGSLTEAINLTGLFIDEGPIVQVKDSNGHVQDYKDTDSGMAWDGPLVVLTSKFSASASEIFAGAIQDYRRGIVVGDESTHGKGTVQSLLDLGSQLFRSLPNAPNLGALKITMQMFYRPNGDSTQKRGVLSDIVLPSITNHLENISESDLDYAIDFDQIPAARYDRYNMVNADLINQLRQRSADRVQASEEFVKLLEKIQRYVEQKAKNTVTLHEEQFMAQRAEMDAAKEEEKQLLEQSEGTEEVFALDYYGKEVLAITVDYLNALGHNKIARVN